MKIVFFLCGNLLFLKMRNKNKKEEKVESAAAFRRRGDPTEKNFFFKSENSKQISFDSNRNDGASLIGRWFYGTKKWRSHQVGGHRRSDSTSLFRSRRRFQIKKKEKRKKITTKKAKRLESNDTIDRAAHRNPKKKQTKKGKTPRLIGCRPLAATNQESSFPFSSNGLALVARATIQQIDNGQRKKDEVLRRRPSRSPEFHGKKRIEWEIEIDRVFPATYGAEQYGGVTSKTVSHWLRYAGRFP